VRVRSFLVAHPTTGPLSDADARTTPDDVIQRPPKMTRRTYPGGRRVRASVTPLTHRNIGP